MKQRQQVTINSRKYDLSLRRSWKCDLIEQNDSLLLLVGEFDEDVEHPGLGDIKRGTLSYEYYWPGRWYNIFRFHEPGGGFRNYYCNIAMPPTFENGVLEYVDLDIDLVVWADSSHEILDLAEHEQNAIRYGYPEEVRSMAATALEELLSLAKNKELPGQNPEP